MTSHTVGYSATAAQENFHVTGKRVVATIVDGLILGLLFAAMASAFGDFAAVQGTWEANLAGLPAFAYGLLALAYFILMEGYLGQTVGKMVAGIKVVKEDSNEVPGLGPATIRTVLRIVDGLFFYLVAFITVLVSSKRQRLGDLAAHTQVVHK
ncbi:MAG: RDD family protein [Actinomycetota bacterium]